MARRRERPAGPLDARTAAILRAVIDEYVATAQPVGSHTLVQRYGLGVSSATVRNVMKELEEAGFIAQPHTSAGRVPTDRGYRLYVETMVDAAELSPVEQLMIRHQFGQVEFASEQWFRLAASTLASVTRAAGLATPAKPKASRVRRLDILGNGDRTAVLVIVLAEGPIKQSILSLPEPVPQPRLDALARELSTRFGGQTAEAIERHLPRLADDDAVGQLRRRVVERLLRVMRDFDTTAVEDVFSEGLLNVMDAPEFAQSEKLRRVFRALQDRDYLGQLVQTVTSDGDVHVLIGAENAPREMHEVSLVLAPYGRPGRATGAVGVLGPRRMQYGQAVSTVRYVSGLMNELVDHLYA
jgi:heat-inducible transcriptional repressor